MLISNMVFLTLPTAFLSKVMNASQIKIRDYRTTYPYRKWLQKLIGVKYAIATRKVDMYFSDKKIHYALKQE